MKKQFSDFIAKLGGTTNYSGNKRIMYINKPAPFKNVSPEAWDTAMSNVLYAFPNLPFSVKENE